MIRSYLKIAFRNLKRHKLYSFINIGGLAVGLAAFMLLALFVHYEFSYDRFNTKATRIYRVVQHASWQGGKFDIALTSAPFAQALKEAYPEIEDAVRIDPEGGGIITYKDKKISADNIIFADNAIFNVFTYHFLYGNANTAFSNPQSIVLTKSLAEKIFGSAAEAMNKTIYFGDHYPNTVTGIIQDVPANSHLRFSAVRNLPADYTSGWQNASLYTYLLLKKGTNVKNLEKKLPQFAANTIQKKMGVKDYHMDLQPLTSIHLHSHLDYEISPNSSISRIYIFICIAVLILLIAMINYMNLSTARSSLRLREVGLRKVLGTDTKNLAGMFISESFIVSIAAMIIAILLMQAVLPYFNQMTGKDLTGWEFGMVKTSLLILFLMLVTGLLSGLYPSLFLSRFKPVPAMRGQMGEQSGNVLFRKMLVVFQFVIAVVMIIGSFVIYKQLQYVQHKDLGFNKDQTLTFHINDMGVRKQIPVLKSQLMQSPLIKGVSAAGNPIGNNDIGQIGFLYETNDGSESNGSKLAEKLAVDADFLNTLQINLEDGRDFSKEMATDQEGSALVNKTLVRELGWKNPVGKKIMLLSDNKIRTVIGVISDFHTYSLQHKVTPMVMIMPPTDMAKDNLYVRIANGKTREGLTYLNKVYRHFDNANPVTYHFLDKNFAKQYGSEEKQGQVALIFTILAVFIASIGLIGLSAFSAQRRTKEIGIRKVLGSSVTAILMLLSKDFLKLVGIGFLIAVPIGWYGMHKWLENFAYHIHIGIWTFVLAGVVAMGIALATVSWQSLHAALMDPVRSLMDE